MPEGHHGLTNMRFEYGRVVAGDDRRHRQLYRQREIGAWHAAPRIDAAIDDFSC